MDKKTKQWLTFAAIVVVAVIVFYYFVKPKDDKDTSEQTSAQNTANDEFPLKSGSQGERVKELQKAFNTILIGRRKNKKTMPQYNGKDLKSIAESGIFDKATETVCEHLTGFTELDASIYYSIIYNEKLYSTSETRKIKL